MQRTIRPYWLTQSGKLLPIVLVSAILLLTGFTKLVSFEGFKDTLSASYLFPASLVGFIGGAFVATELLIALALLVPKTRLLALRGTILLGSLLLGYQAWRWFGGIATPCSCLGALYNLSFGESLLLIGLMLSSAVAGIRGKNFKPSGRPLKLAILSFGLSVVALTSLVLPAFADGPKPTPGGCTGTGCDNDNECVGRKWKVWLGLDRCTWGFGSCDNIYPRPCYKLFQMTGAGCTGTMLYPPTIVDEKACR